MNFMGFAILGTCHSGQAIMCESKDREPDHGIRMKWGHDVSRVGVVAGKEFAHMTLDAERIWIASGQTRAELIH